MTDVAIEVRDLVKVYGEVRALEGISFEVPAGTVFGLLGPNGAGKTTAIRILSTVLRPDGGRAAVLGFDVARQPDEVRYRIGLAGQFAAVDPNLTGRENLRMIGKLVQLPRAQVGARATELLERFGLADAGDRPVRTYSGGMRRRLDLAAALVQRPAVLFFDEPTTGLDPQSRQELWEMTRELVADGTTVLLTTQYLEEADRLAQRIAVIDRGRVIALDTPAALKARMGSTVVELAFRDEAEAARALGVLGVIDEHKEREGTLVRFTTDDGPRLVKRALDALDGRAAPASLAVREPSLDDVFLSLTGRHADDEARPTAQGATRKEARVTTTQHAIERRRTPLIGPARDALAIAQRNLIALRRVPQLVVFSTIQPVIFVLMFRYVFGGAIQIPGVAYVDYLMPGIFVQTVVFGAMGAAIGLASDMKSGLLERFQSLPMARSAVLAGRTIADLARNLFVIALMVAVGFAVGFRIHLGAPRFLLAIGIVLMFAYTLSWVFATLGLAVGDPETAQAAAFPLMAPLVFASSAFVSVESMPGWLEVFARHQPVSLTACAARGLTLPAEVVEPLCGSLASNVWQALAWYVGILLVFAPIAVRRYRRAV